MPETAAEQLRRILHIVPRVADGEERAIEDVMRIVGADDARTLFADLESLAERYDAPAGFVEGVQIFIDTERLSVVSSHFLRPMRLTMPELCALELGLTMIRRECTPDEHAPIDRAIERLRTVITKLPTNDAWAGLRHAELAGSGDMRHLATLRDALTRHRKVRLCYHGGGAKGTSERVVRPYRLVFSSGAWYLTAFCEQAEEIRFFRLDRVESAESIDEKFVDVDARVIEDVLREQKPLSSGDSPTMVVKYSPRIARWILEREGGMIADDGSLTREYPLKDLGWGVRHALQYGPEAEVLSPPEVREEIVRRLSVHP